MTSPHGLDYKVESSVPHTTPAVISSSCYLCLATVHLHYYLKPYPSLSWGLEMKPVRFWILLFSILWNRLYHRYDNIYISCQWIWNVQISQVSDCTSLVTVLSFLLPANLPSSKTGWRLLLLICSPESCQSRDCPQGAAQESDETSGFCN